MKFNIIIDGIETLFPEADICYFKDDNEIVIYFLNLDEKIFKKTKENIKNSNLRIENNHLILKIKDLQYAHDLSKNPKLIDLYMSGYSLGFAFEGEDSKVLDMATPVYHNAV